jgi:hypothetical protein
MQMTYTAKIYTDTFNSSTKKWCADLHENGSLLFKKWQSGYTSKARLIKGIEAGTPHGVAMEIDNS